MPRRRAYPAASQAYLAESAARTTTGSGASVTGWARSAGAAVTKLDVTAVGGTPTLVVTIQDSPDATTWTTRDTFAAKTTTGTETRPLPAGMAPYVRASWAITGGTPSATFSVQVAASSAALL